jgi:hypothetical protein
MSDIEITDLKVDSEISNEEMAKLSGGYAIYDKATGAKTLWSWNLSNISLLDLSSTSTTLK